MKPTITAIIIARNEEAMIANCIETLRWCDEILVINNESADATVGIAHRLGARVITLGGSFAELRNEGLRRSKTDWLFYIDADERVTPALAKEVIRVTADPEVQPVAFSVSRANVMYGEYFRHGGWQDDRVIRLFKREAIKKWAGLIHEHAEVAGETGALKHQLIHLTHRNVIEGLKKTVEWTPLEAQQLFEAGIAPVTAFTLIRKGGMEVFRRLIHRQGYKDGQAGWIEAFVQGINRVLVYIQVWELQHKPSLKDKYLSHEDSVVELWKRQQSR